MSVRVDSKSGLKVFNTRAAKASEKIMGQGYSAITDEALKTLPPAPAGAMQNGSARLDFPAPSVNGVPRRSITDWLAGSEPCERCTHRA